MKYCTQCGTASKDGARFCGKCGARQKEMAAVRGEVKSVAVTPPAVAAEQQETVADLVFACPDCAKVFAIDARGSGRSCKCTDCHAAISIPEPAVRFSCPKCRHALGAPKEMLGIEMQCPECKSGIVVPTVASDPKAPVASFKQDAGGELSPPPQPQRARTRLELPGLEGRPVRVELPPVTEGRRFLMIGADGKTYGPVTVTQKNFDSGSARVAFTWRHASKSKAMPTSELHDLRSCPRWLSEIQSSCRFSRSRGPYRLYAPAKDTQV